MSSREHYIKCWPDPFDAIGDGRKTFEIRKNDREYQTGDILVLQKYDPNKRLYGFPSGAYIDKNGDPHSDPILAATIRVKVTYMLSDFGLEKGYVCMGLEHVQPIALGRRVAESLSNSNKITLQHSTMSIQNKG